MTRYPSVADVRATHRKLIERFGGASGVRDEAALEAAVARPRTGYYADLIDEAAALWESLSQNHPFIDGNKRVAVTVAVAFLRVNGVRLQFDDPDAYRFMIDLYEGGDFTRDRLAKWLRGAASA